MAGSKPGPDPRTTRDEMVKVIKQCRGRAAMAARALGISRQRLYTVVGSEEIAAIRTEWNETELDWAEEKFLAMAMQDEDTDLAYKALRTFLLTKGKDRGWRYQDPPPALNLQVAHIHASLNEVLQHVESDPRWLGYAQGSYAGDIAGLLRDGSQPGRGDDDLPPGPEPDSPLATRPSSAAD